MRHKVFLFVIAAVLTIVCMTANAKAKEPATVVPIDQDGIQKVEIVGGSYFFKPNYIVVKLNVPVELKISKESGLTPHDMVANSPEAGIVFQESLGSSAKTIRFTPIKIGVYPIYCSLSAPFSKSHREKGMEGAIEVVP